MSAATRARFADAVRAEPVDLGLACLLVAGEVDDHLDVEAGLARLDELAAATRPLIRPGGGPEIAAEALQVALGERAGFAGSGADYDDLRSSLLSEVLMRRRGLPLLLSVVWLEVADRVDVPAFPIALPGHVVVCVGDPDDRHVHVDPFDGGRRLDHADLEERVRAASGQPLQPDHLRPVTANDLLLRLLTNIRVLTTRQPQAFEAIRTRLWATELSLLLPHHPLELRRERGQLLVRLGDHIGGARELEGFAALVSGADDDAARAAQAEARQARARLN